MKITVIWNKLAEKKPDIGTWVLVFSLNHGRAITWYDGKKFTNSYGHLIKNVSHWMFIPEPPK